MSTFDEIIEKVLSYEGEYVNHPSDPGGETMWGITKHVAVAHGYAGEMRDLTRDRAKEIYNKSYWARIRGDELPERIALQVMDAAVNHGVGNAIRILQRALNVADDGVFGNITLRALSEHATHEIAVLFVLERMRFYTKLSAFPTFGRGWINRSIKQLEAALA